MSLQHKRKYSSHQRGIFFKIAGILQRKVSVRVFILGHGRGENVYTFCNKVDGLVKEMGDFEVDT